MIDNTQDIKDFIIDSSNDLNEINLFLENEFKTTIKVIFDVLFILLKQYGQNKKRTDELISFLEHLIEKVPISKLSYFVAPFRGFERKIEHDFKLKQKRAIKKPYLQIHNIFTNLNYKLLLNTHEGKISYLEFLIFQDQNMALVETFLEDYSNVLDGGRDGEENIFEIILKKYLFLDEKSYSEIDFLYHVIVLFIQSRHGEKILEEKQHYLDMIRQSKLGYKEHIIRVIELFDPDFSISFSEIEERYGVNFSFPNVIMQELETFRMDFKRRFDFTDQECITIDGENALILDDAIYLEQNKNGTYSLYIHITDIPSFIPYSSLVNEEASRRIETLYLKDNGISLYPDCISSDICSLLPNCPRNVVSYIFQLDSNFELIDDKFRVVKGTICSKYKLSYDQVDQMILHPTEEPLNLMVRQLFRFARNRRNQNKKKEQYRQYENFLYFEKHHESLKLDYSPSANIVHESMILVNYSIAKYFKKKNFPYVYREVMVPSDDFIEKQLLKIQKLDSSLKEDEKFLRNLRKSYIEALYSEEAVYHQGLDLECYSHSTSPARRYADAFGQYLIYEFLFQKNLSDFNVQCWEYRVHHMIQYLNKKKKENEVFSSQYNYLSYKRKIKMK